jgi:hypothetical protein
MTPEKDGEAPPRGDLALRIAGSVVAVWGAALLGVVGALFTPVRVSGQLVPVSVLLAIGGNLGLMWFAYVTTARRGLALLPGAVWIVVAFVASTGTREGDVVISSRNWVGSVYLLAGTATIGLTAYRLLFAPVKPPSLRPPAVTGRR